MLDQAKAELHIIWELLDPLAQQQTAIRAQVQAQVRVGVQGRMDGIEATLRNDLTERRSLPSKNRTLKQEMVLLRYVLAPVILY